jgi:peptidoglycan/LPS O-acetylase OafA/YrhL
MKKLNLILGLDGLRGLSVIFVVLYHYTYVFFTNPQITGGLHNFYSFLHWGWIGVDLFFVLSGFLITRILLNSKGSKSYFKNFYIRRGLRIFPLYYGVLILYFIILPLVGRPIVTLGINHQQIYLWTYSINLFQSKEGFGDLSHFWSLCVEEHFYFLWPIVIYFFDLKKIKYIAYAYIVFSLMLKNLLFYHYNLPFDFIKLLSFCRFDNILFGAILVFELISKDEVNQTSQIYPKRIIGLFVLSLIFSILRLDYTGMFLYSVTSVLYSLFFVEIIRCCVHEKNKVKDFFCNPFLNWLGRYSYGIYILHLPTQRLSSIMNRKLGPIVEKIFDPLSFGYHLYWVTLCSVVTLIIAVLCWHIYENQFIKLKDRFSSHMP